MLGRLNAMRKNQKKPVTPWTAADVIVENKKLDGCQNVGLYEVKVKSQKIFKPLFFVKVISGGAWKRGQTTKAKDQGERERLEEVMMNNELWKSPKNLELRKKDKAYLTPYEGAFTLQDNYAKYTVLYNHMAQKASTTDQDEPEIKTLFYTWGWRNALKWPEKKTEEKHLLASKTIRELAKSMVPLYTQGKQYKTPQEVPHGRLLGDAHSGNMIVKETETNKELITPMIVDMDLLGNGAKGFLLSDFAHWGLKRETRQNNHEVNFPSSLQAYRLIAIMEGVAEAFEDPIASLRFIKQEIKELMNSKTQEETIKRWFNKTEKLITNLDEVDSITRTDEQQIRLSNAAINAQMYMSEPITQWCDS